MAISQVAHTTPEPSTRSNRQQRRHPERPRVYVGIPEAATYLDVATKTIRRMITEGKLPGYRLGNRVIKVKITDLDAILTPIGGSAS